MIKFKKVTVLIIIMVNNGLFHIVYLKFDIIKILLMINNQLFLLLIVFLIIIFDNSVKIDHLKKWFVM